MSTAPTFESISPSPDCTFPSRSLPLLRISAWKLSCRFKASPRASLRIGSQRSAMTTSSSFSVANVNLMCFYAIAAARLLPTSRIRLSFAFDRKGR
jgi:hypothetical protein